MPLLAKLQSKPREEQLLAPLKACVLLKYNVSTLFFRHLARPIVVRHRPDIGQT